MEMAPNILEYKIRRIMKAVQISAYGPEDVLSLNTDVPKPVPLQGQISVKVHAAAINPFDVKVLTGMMKDYMPKPLPVTLGGDFSGIVTEVGDGVNGFSAGDAVYGSANVFNGGSGSFAEYVIANSANSARKPETADFLQAAALPLAGASAIQALEEHIHLHGGQKILIHGGAGGIGTMAIQLAKALGAYVATTVRQDDIPFVIALGADTAIDYGRQKFEDMLSDYDAVFDTVGGETTNRSFRILKKGGMLVSMLGAPDPILAEQYGVIAIGQNTKTNTEHLTRLAELVDGGKIKARVDKVFRLDQVKEAFRYQIHQPPRGKVVVRITE